MDTTNIAIIVIVGVALLALVIFLIWKNKKDKKVLNPDAEDAVEETIADQERNKDSY
jgi:LPXTG-motif cell wall-anchored protein